MAVLYTQIIASTTKKILSGSYSAVGSAIDGDTLVLKELKSTVSNASPSSSNIYEHCYGKSNLVIYVYSKDGLTAAMICDKPTNKAELITFMHEVMNEYKRDFKDTTSAHYEFDENIRKISDGFNRHSGIKKGARELEEAHGILVENLDTLINRGENINVLKSLADKVNLETREISRKVNAIKRNAQMDKYKIYVMIALVLLFVFYLIFR
ncbi:hypothetical protein ENBRE01_0206 [Enteropsectra breve]|nr:hypothetical protein ENBRE01_0206 [Enteropsectra breve]